MISPWHLLALIAVAIWWFAVRRPRRGLLLLYWWVGLVLLWGVPLAFGLAAPAVGSGPIGLLPLQLSYWIGAVLLLRALVGLTGWDRPAGKGTRIFAWLFAVALVVPVFAGANGVAALVLALPWLFWYRWRDGLRPGELVLAAATALVSFLLAIIRVDRSALESGDSGLVVLAAQVNLLVGLYAFVGLFKAGSRMHLSIRRIGPRLFSSHVLAGSVPFILAVLFLGLAGALYLSTYRGSIAARMLEQSSRDAEGRLRRTFALSEQLDPAPFGEGDGQVLLVREGDGPVRKLGAPVPFPGDSLLAKEISPRQVPILWDGERLYLRARFDTTGSGGAVRMEALLPVDSLRMVRISRVVGMEVRTDPALRVEAGGGSVRVGEDEASSPGSRRIGPRSTGKMEVPGGAALECLRWRDPGWERAAVPILSSAGFAESLVSLFGITRENPLVWVVILVLGLIALFFLIAIWITIAMVVQMGRSITQAVHALTGATAALGQGRLDHRIEISGNDELWDVARQFNQMAEGLEQTRAVELQSQRMEEELRLAREIQNRLLPSAPPELDWLELAGTSLPARQVGGDYFDYLPLPDGRVGIAVADVSGKGAPAALLMSSFRASLRTQDLAGHGPAEVLGRLNRFIHASVDPGKFITAFLGLLDPEAGTIRYANAGHDPPLLIGVDGETKELTGGGLILGMLPQIAYEEASASFPAGSLVSIFTDGVTEAQRPDGEFFGMERLRAVLREVRSEPCDAALRRVVDVVQEFGDGDQYDDITMILARRR
ncbi:MAG: SpoIIE family protein phosphatase [Candidatus Eisenbacteria bacterium]|nr:SpoIIE family protein phosphatase [Candidatus Latescibacterota bacterium]MBD3302598.1 SpoIIE family protein phosphatase [Candidatus Eisenbacteria bacterium]